jgi:hypothetical protein
MELVLRILKESVVEPMTAWQAIRILEYSYTGLEGF